MSASTGNNIKILSNTIFLYTRMVITTIVALFTVRVVFNALGVTDYGLYNAVGGIILSMTFISKVLALASQRFFSFSLGKNDIAELKRNLCAIVVVYILLSLIIVIIAETFGLWFLNTKMTIPEDRLIASNITYQLSIIGFLITILSSPYQALIISYEEMKVFAYISILDVFLKLIIVIFLLIDFNADKLVLYAILMLFATFFSNIIYFIFCKRHYSAILGKLKWEWRKIKSILSYSSWTLFGTLSGVFSNQGIGIVFNVFWGPVSNAAFAIASQVSNQANMLASNFFTAVRPALTKSYARNDKEYTKDLYFISSKIIFVLLFLVLLPLYIETEEILQLWLGNVQPYMIDFVRQMLIFVLILSLSNPITAIIQAAGAVKSYHLIVDGFTLLSLPISLLFVNIGCEAIHVLYIFNLVFFIAHVIRIILLKKAVPYITLVGNLRYLGIPMLAVSIISSVVAFFVKSQTGSGIFSLLCTLACTSTVILITSYAVLLTREEQRKTAEIIIRKVTKRNNH